MKRFSHIVMMALVLMMATTASAQSAGKNHPRWRDFKTNGFGDNWELSVGGGTSILFLSGKNSNPGKLTDRTGWNVNIGATKWFVPTLGMRLKVDGGEFRNFATQSGLKNQGPYNTPYIHVHGDIMIHMSNWIGGYRSDRFYNAISYVGFGYSAMSFTDKSLGSYNGEYAFSLGMVNKFRVSPQVDIELDLRSWLFPQSTLPTEIRGSGRFAFATSASLGVAYRFNRRDWSVAVPDVVVDGYIAAIVGLEEDLLATATMLEECGKENNTLKSQNKALSDDLAACKKRNSAATPAKVITDDVLFFSIGEATLSDYAKATLKSLTSNLASTDVKITISGYADKETGSAERNMQLSQERAEAVAGYLEGQGIKRDRMALEWFGDTVQPFTELGVATNRCVVIR